MDLEKLLAKADATRIGLIQEHRAQARERVLYLGHYAEISRIAHQVKGSDLREDVREAHQSGLKCVLAWHMISDHLWDAEPICRRVQLLLRKMYFTPSDVFVRR